MAYRIWILPQVDLNRIFDRLTRELNDVARVSKEKQTPPTVAVIDSQSVRTGLARSVKGIDGGKKIKGIKRHPAVDSNGFPLTIVTSRANIHITIASANRHASASACFGRNATALLPHCANSSARRLTAPALTNIGQRGLIYEMIIFPSLNHGKNCSIRFF